MIRLGSMLLLVALAGTGDDGFGRERGRDAERDKAVDALEGKPAPPLQVEGWLNTGGKALDLKSLRGKVILLDFWGVW